MQTCLSEIEKIKKCVNLQLKLFISSNLCAKLCLVWMKKKNTFWYCAERIQSSSNRLYNILKCVFILFVCKYCRCIICEVSYVWLRCGWNPSLLWILYITNVFWLIFSLKNRYTNQRHSSVRDTNKDGQGLYPYCLYL